jgi:hypothetical protein
MKNFFANLLGSNRKIQFKPDSKQLHEALSISNERNKELKDVFEKVGEEHNGKPLAYFLEGIVNLKLPYNEEVYLLCQAIRFFENM